MRPQKILETVEGRTDEEIGDYLYKACIFHGAPVGVAHKVTGMFLEGLRKEGILRERKKP